MEQRKQEQIQNKRNEISQARAEKGALLDQGKQEQAKLESKHAERKKLVSKLQKQQRKVQSTLQANKKQYNSLNAQIDKLIQQQIAEERRRREEARKRELERQRRLAAANKKKSRSSKSKSSSKRSSERSSEEKREQMAVFEMEKADRALSNNFASNRGRLPVPITGSYMITTHYGQYTPDGLNELDALKPYDTRPQGFTKPGIKVYHVDSRIAECHFDEAGNGVFDRYVEAIPEDKGESFYLIGANANNVDSYTDASRVGRYKQIQLIENKKVNLLQSGYPADDDSLFYEGDVFDSSDCSAYISNGLFNNREEIGFEVKVNSLGETASLTITYEGK